jgi:hypothetical protein
MLDEFGQAQMQMADRFQETVMVVLQSFAGLHGEQMALIREEMARIRELSKEQEALRSQAEGHGFGGSSPPALRLVACESRATPEGPHPNAMPPAPQSRTGRTPPSPTNEGRVEREEAAGPAASRAEESRPHPPVPSDLHSQIVNRLAEIQEERQGRWQKLLKSLLG